MIEFLYLFADVVTSLIRTVALRRSDNGGTEKRIVALIWRRVIDMSEVLNTILFTS